MHGSSESGATPSSMVPTAALANPGICPRYLKSSVRSLSRSTFISFSS